MQICWYLLNLQYSRSNLSTTIAAYVDMSKAEELKLNIIVGMKIFVANIVEISGRRFACGYHVEPAIFFQNEAIFI